MKKICYVVTIPLTIKAFFIPQLQYLSMHGFDVTVVCSDDSKLQELLGERIHFVPVNIPRGISIRGSILAIKKLKKFFKKEKFDLIQYSTPNAALYASIASKKSGCKVRNYHLMGFRYLGAKGIGKVILKTIEKITCNNSTSIECVSKSNMELGIREKLFQSDKATVVWNGSTGGVDLFRFDFAKREEWRQEIRAELGYSKNDFVYGFVGRITRDKGINELLEAFNELNGYDKLFLIGSIENEETLNKELLKEAYSKNNVQFHNPVSDIERYYAAIDVLVLPSHREGFGNVIIEAGAVGTPSIVSNIPGPIDTIEEGKTALIVEMRDIESLKNAMKNIKKLDYKEMGIRANKYVTQHFDSRRLCEAILFRKRELLGDQI